MVFNWIMAWCRMEFCHLGTLLFFLFNIGKGNLELAGKKKGREEVSWKNSGHIGKPMATWLYISDSIVWMGAILL